MGKSSGGRPSRIGLSARPAIGTCIAVTKVSARRRLAKIRRPRRTPPTIRETVVQEHKVRGFPRHVRALAPHGHADVGRLERGRIVHAVTGHGHDLAVGLERLDDAELLLGYDVGDVPDASQSCSNGKRAISGPVSTPALVFTPARRAIASAVAGRSPVIMTTLIPAAVASASAAGTSGRSGSTKPSRPANSNAWLREPSPNSACGTAEATPSTRRPCSA